MSGKQVDPKIKEILERCQLPHLESIFAENEIDFDSFLSMQAGDFNDLQINLGPRAKLTRMQQRLLAGEEGMPDGAHIPVTAVASASSAPAGAGIPPQQPAAPRPYAPQGGNWGNNAGFGGAGGGPSYDNNYAGQAGSYGGGGHGNHAQGGWNDENHVAPDGQDPGYSEFNLDPNVDELFTKHINTGIDFDKYGELPVETFGENIPEERPTFEAMGMPQWLRRNVERIGWSKPTPIQRRAIPCVLEKRHVMGCAQTGSGKTAAFLFPVLIHLDKEGSRSNATGLVLAPTRELVQQIFEEAKKFSFGSRNILVEAIFGGGRASDQLRRLRRGVDILIATPGRLIDFLGRQMVSLRDTKFFVLDEADRMLDMGFGPEIRKVMTCYDMPPANSLQMLMFSATLGPQVVDLAKEFLEEEIFLAIGKIGGTTESITQKIMYVDPRDKYQALAELIQQHTGRVLVFCSTKRECDALNREFDRISAAIHGDKAQFQREKALKDFRSGRTRMLIATDVASRGLDIPDIEVVINYDLPNTLDDYVHRIGRTGRAGNRGLAIAFYNDRENWQLRNALCGLLVENKQEVPEFFDKTSAMSADQRKREAGASRLSRPGFQGGGGYRGGKGGGNRSYGGGGGHGGKGYGGGGGGGGWNGGGGGGFGGGPAGGNADGWGGGGGKGGW